MYSPLQFATGLEIPRPPNLTGNEKSSWILSLGGPLPVMAGISFFWIHSSRGESRLAIDFVVQHRHIHLLERPFMKAEYAACGCDIATSDKTLIWVLQSDTLAITYFETQSLELIGGPR